MDKNTQDVMFSSNSGGWGTPLELFEFLDEYFHFTLDVCATAENTLTDKFYSPEDNGLVKSWDKCWWCNPEYGRKIKPWIQKGAESYQNGRTGVMLIPGRTETEWFQTIWDHAQLIVFIRKRLQFRGADSSAPFPSVLAVLSQLDWSHLRRPLSTLGNVVVNTGIVQFTGKRKQSSCTVTSTVLPFE